MYTGHRFNRESHSAVAVEDAAFDTKATTPCDQPSHETLYRHAADLVDRSISQQEAVFKRTDGTASGARFLGVLLWSHTLYSATHWQSCDSTQGW
jgi:hypothetical protein